jgi:hypothetical protein
MSDFRADVEAGDDSYKPEPEIEEQQTLLPSSARDPHTSPSTSPLPACCSIKGRTFSLPYLVISFIAGTLACFLAQYTLFGTACFTSKSSADNSAHVLAPPYVGSTEVHNWPPATPTNNVPPLFPTDVGHAGITPTGAEPALILTAPSYPVHTGAAQLVLPSTLHSGTKPKKHFDLFKNWGNLSPWYSVKRGAFGINSDPGAPDGCNVTGLHLLHRHGARYPTSWCEWIDGPIFFYLIDRKKAPYGGPASLARRLNEAAANWTAQGDLDFLNNW